MTSTAVSTASAPSHDTARARVLRRVRPRLVSGIAIALFILIAGRVYERVVFGAAEPDTMRRVAAGVRAEIASMTRELGETAARVRLDPARLGTSADAEAMRKLFDAAAEAIAALPAGHSALTIYSPNGTPLAWAGRPSELPIDRVAGPRAVFIAPGPLGARLVYVAPIVSADTPVLRLGAIAVERRLGEVPAFDEPATPEMRLDTGIVPVVLRPRYEGGGESRPPYGFVVNASDGSALFEAEVEPGAVAASRQAVRQVAANWALLTLAITLLVGMVPIVEWRERTRERAAFMVATTSIAAALIGAAVLGAAAVPHAWWWADWSARGPALGWILRSPAHLLAVSLAALGLVTVAADTIERRRHTRRHVVRPQTLAAAATFAVAQVAAGTAVAGIIAAHHALFTRIVAAAGDALQFSLHPFTVARVTLLCAMVLLQASLLWAMIVVLRLAVTSWRVRRDDLALRAVVAALWLAPALVLAAMGAPGGGARAPIGILVVAVVAVAGTAFLRWLVPRYRHASQSWRLLVRFCALAIPSLVFYPALVGIADTATEHKIADTLAPQALAHRTALQDQLRRSLAQIDDIPGLIDLVSAIHTREGEPPSSDAAFAIWRQTDLARQRLTSSVELYGPDGTLLSRFALNLPVEAGTIESGCSWGIFGEPIAGGEDRVLLHAGRSLCGDRGVVHGGIVVHVMLDYGTLPFLAARNPYGDMLPSNGEVPGDAHGRMISFAMYGWGRTPIFPTEGTAWPISSTLLSRIYEAGRAPLWEIVMRGERRWRVLFLNDRAGIYALGYPLPATIDHFVAVAELLTLTAVVFASLLAATGAIAALGGYRASTARALLREIRRSFYRKLFLAFVAAAVVPVIALAVLTRAYIATQLRDSIESAAGRTASVAKRVVDSVATQQRRDSGVPPVLTDELMVGVSRVINQDVNVFTGPRLTATSQRDLFASGLLPMRTPAEVYRAIVLERQASYVGEERIADVPYMIAAAPVREGEVRTTLTVPLALRQQEIEREIDALDRRVLLATVCFILLGAAIGYSMAERIADPISRLTRATRRIATGDLDARIATGSSDEFRRLVDAFNSMAADLARQRAELERTHRLEAWAEMARQVAHDIKNPLTPIQLSAEHLRRVHEDRGEPLSPVLEGCVATILSQVRLLRQISSEFSSFASSPVARLAPTVLDDVVEEVIAPYRAAPPARITIEMALETGGITLPLDRTLVGRALVNVVENAIHAMPNGGRLVLRTTASPDRVVLTVSDTGVGMDREARARLFEPYFSTRAAGTGLGLTIAKRNVELNHGTIEVGSEPDRGTTVQMTFLREGIHA